MTTIDNSATAWLRHLVANGADAHQIEAWMRYELDADPLAFRALMTDAEISRAQLVIIRQRLRELTPAMRSAIRVMQQAAIAAASLGRSLTRIDGQVA